MLSFKDFDKENIDSFLQSVLNENSDVDEAYLDEILESLCDYEDTEYALSYNCGCLLIRCFDSYYSFLYPIALCDEADLVSSIFAIRDYAVKEEIPLIFTDVPCDELGRLLSCFRHANVDASDAYGESYAVKILSEAALLEDVGRIYLDDLTLEALRAEDDAPYARLCKDEETNRFWGYDYSLDISDPADSYFRENAETEFSRGVSISFAIRLEEDFVGETILYAFDLSGGCDWAVRILPEFRRMKIAERVLHRMVEFAGDLGITRVRARVKKDNIPSISLCQKNFEKMEEKEDGIVEFLTEL